MREFSEADSHRSKAFKAFLVWIFYHFPVYLRREPVLAWVHSRRSEPVPGSRVLMWTDNGMLWSKETNESLWWDVSAHGLEFLHPIAKRFALETSCDLVKEFSTLSVQTGV